MNHYNDSSLPPHGGYGFDARQYPPYGAPAPETWHRPIRRNANIVCLGLIAVTLLSDFLFRAFAALTVRLINGLGIESRAVLSCVETSRDIVVTVLMLGIPMIIMRLWIGIPVRVAFPMRKPRASVAIPAVMICLGASVIGLMVTSALLAWIKALFGVDQVIPSFSEPVGVVAVILHFIRIAALPAVLEELMFRGVIMQSLRRFGDTFALICSSALFSLAHHNLAQGINAFLLGAVIGFFVLRTGSLKTSIMIHFINNAFTVAVDLLTKDMHAGKLEMFMLLVLAFYIISGLIGFVILLLRHGRIFSLVPSDYPVSEKRKYSLFFLTVAPIIYICLIVFITCRQFR